MYQVTFLDKAAKSLLSIPSNHRQVISKKIDTLKNFNFSTPNVKKLSGNWQGFYRLRAGDYRIVFEVQNNVLVIVIVDIFHRQKDY